MTENLCDSNVWLALALSGHVHHESARDWLDSVDETAAILFCRATQSTFLRLLTNGTVLAAYGNEPLSNSAAWAAYDSLVSDDRIVFTGDEPGGIEPRWRTLALRKTASPKLWMDTYLAAFALAGGYRLVSTDAAFRQFRGLDLLLVGEVSAG